MSEHAKASASVPSCLHCSAYGSKLKFQEIFDEFGLELGLQQLLAKHFDLVVKPNEKQQQILCAECVNVLIRLFDIDEVQQQQDAAIAKRKNAASPEAKSAVKTPPKPAKQTTPPKPQVKVEKPPVPAVQLREPSRRIIKNSAAVVVDKVVVPARTIVQVSPPITRAKRAPKDADQEQISALILNILNEDEPGEEEDDDADNLCSREFASEVTYNVHMKSHLIIERDLHICVSCGQLSESEEKMNEHLAVEDSACYGAESCVELLRDAYVCEYCTTYFKQKSDLQAHRESGVHDNGVFWCQPCDKEFPDMKLYRHHLRNFQALRTDVAHRKMDICTFFMCDQKGCSAAYANWNSLYTHKRRTHDAPEKQQEKSAKPLQEWQCQFCLKLCRSKMSLSVHVARSHNNDNVVCSLCNASYKSKEALENHHAYWHEPIECPQCFKIVKNRRNYDTHVNVVHSNKKRYTCSVCEKGFYHKSEMEAHKRLHSQSYSCDQCSFTTRNKKSLSVHTLGQHFKRFAFDCKMCDKHFGRRQGLTNHIQRVHASKHVCRNYIDDGCARSFNTSLQLKMHLRKVHNSTLVSDDVLEEEAYASARAPPAKRRRLGLGQDTTDDTADDLDRIKDDDYRPEEDEEDVEEEEQEEECELEFTVDEAEAEHKPKPNTGSLTVRHGRKNRSN
ncbi:zinc finger protein 600 isoform X2 [Drosophila subobscura]|uniref:zinc finger protein 600 isoform X2 n=1 Tax=Drosophila subobscura TaxID=7241 RepID=UPI00155A695B|nr:zinc finger protein 600 isoform X2 [Drosophila subobscura]